MRQSEDNLVVPCLVSETKHRYESHFAIVASLEIDKVLIITFFNFLQTFKSKEVARLTPDDYQVLIKVRLNALSKTLKTFIFGCFFV